ncbi:MAG TPA: hypothetical protein VIL71_19470 [Spirillospora sp.]
MSAAPRFPWVIALTVAGVVVAQALAALYMWRLASVHHAAAMGADGTPGVFVAHETRGVKAPLTSRPDCYGTFVPDGGDVVVRDVRAFEVSASGCVRGRTYRAHYVRGQAVPLGSQAWKSDRWGAIVLTTSTPVTAVLGILAVFFHRRRRKAAGAGHHPLR